MLSDAGHEPDAVRFSHLLGSYHAPRERDALIEHCLLRRRDLVSC